MGKTEKYDNKPVFYQGCAHSRLTQTTDKIIFAIDMHDSGICPALTFTF